MESKKSLLRIVAEEHELHGSRVEFDRGGIHRVHASHAAAFMGLVKDDVDGTDEAVCKVNRWDVGGQTPTLLEVANHGHEPLEHRFHVAIDQPTHPRAAPLAFVVHQANELGIPRHVVHMGADPCTNGIDWISRGRDVDSGIEPDTDLFEGSIDRRLPELQLVVEVVAEQSQRHFRPSGNLSRLGSFEAHLGERLLGGLQDSLASFDDAGD